ncbi:MAG: mechanosensitive ion channel [Bacillota bacterium]|nr:mechanosensitive ion channel [Bacillota bacterium]
MTAILQSIIAGTPLEKLLATGILAVIFAAVLYAMARWVWPPLQRHWNREEAGTIVSFLHAFSLPLAAGWILLALGLIASFWYPDWAITARGTKAIRIATILLTSWGLWRLSAHTARWLQLLTKRYGLEFQKVLLPVLTGLLRFATVAVAATMILQEFGYRIESLIAGLGLGGLAVALAAQNTLSNLFAGAVILVEKTFDIGDWIEAGTVSGTVEEITIRSTKVRSFDQGLVIVPNSTLVAGPLKNWTRMGRRRVMFRVGLSLYTPPEKIGRFLGRIRDSVTCDPDIYQDTLHIYFDQLNPDALSVMVYFFTRTINWDQWLKIVERTNLKILEILQEEEISLALPIRQIVRDGELPSAAEPTRKDPPSEPGPQG